MLDLNHVQSGGGSPIDPVDVILELSYLDENCDAQ